ncbi:hypothetical protein [Actinomadura luteofluorescens]|uniref:hypothetical protein n=1 Tax=Actinomadura luteofluorescens TaxID=46163 RepID=UPI003D8E5F91
MAQRSQFTHEPVEKLSPLRLELVQLIRHLCNCIREDDRQLSSAEISGLLDIRPPSLSHLAHGKRLPASRTLTKLWHQAQARLGHGEELPWTLEEALDLLVQASAEHAMLRKLRESQEAQSKEPPATPECPPAMGTGLPVPRPDADRQPSPEPALSWGPTGELRKYIENGRASDALHFLEHAGRTLPPGELADAVGACKAAGLPDVVEPMLRAASAREATDAKAILREFLRRGWLYEIELLLGEPR